MQLTLFESLLLGHIIGDYFWQNNFLAFGKSGPGIKGILICVLHCLLYTVAICIFTQSFYWLWIIGIFFSHFIIDRYSLADKYLQIIRGRSFKEFWKHNTEAGSWILFGSFSGIVYTIIDNSMHLLLMLVIYKFIF